MLDGLRSIFSGWMYEGDATDESDTDRNGFLSYSGEAHASGVGIGAGFLLTAQNNEKVYGLVIAAITAGLRGESSRKFSPILRDVKDEPHYAGFGVVVGCILGLGFKHLV